MIKNATPIVGTTLFICKNGIVSFEIGIPLNKRGDRVLVGSLGNNLKRVEDTDFYKFIAIKQRYKNIINNGIFTLDTVPKAPYKVIPKLVKPERQQGPSQIAPIKLSLIGDELRECSGKAIPALTCKTVGTNIEESLYFLVKGGKTQFKLCSGMVIQVAFDGETFFYKYQ